MLISGAVAKVLRIRSSCTWVRTRGPSDWFRPFYTVNAAVGMGLLFFLAGYFVPRSYDRKGLGRILKERWSHRSTFADLRVGGAPSRRAEAEAAVAGEQGCVDGPQPL